MLKILGTTCIIAGMLGSACTHNLRGPCDTPPPFRVLLEAGQRLNLDAKGQSLPTSVEILQVRDLKEFDQKDFPEIFQSPREALGANLLKLDELVVDPGQSVDRWTERDPKANYVIVAGIFRKPSGQTWRSFYALPQVFTSQCHPQVASSTRGTPLRDDLDIRFKMEGYQILNAGLYDGSERR